jgi:hypothetical protein
LADVAAFGVRTGPKDRVQKSNAVLAKNGRLRLAGALQEFCCLMGDGDIVGVPASGGAVGFESAKKVAISLREKRAGEWPLRVGRQSSFQCANWPERSSHEN